MDTPRAAETPHPLGSQIMTADRHHPARLGLFGGGFLALALFLPAPAPGQDKDKPKEDKPAPKGVETWKVELDEEKQDDKKLRFKQGEAVQIAVQSTTRGDVDLEVLDANNKRLIADVTFGPNCYVKFTAPKSEEYTVRVKNWGPGVSKSIVELRRVTEVVSDKVDEGVKTWRSELTVNDGFDKVRQGCRAKTYNYKMKAGVTYTIRMHTATPGFDPYLRLETAAGQQLAQDDDGDGFPNAKIVYNCTQAGTYRIIATSFSANVGAYTLSVTPSR
jgi:hypothetical protein